MSWAEVMRINSDLDVPLNHLLWLNDYKTYGENSYAFVNKDILNKVYESYAVSMNDPEIRGEAASYVLSQNKEVGKAIKNIYGINNSIAWDSLSTISSILGNTSAFNAVMGASWFAELFISSSVVMSNILSNTTNVRNVLESDSAMRTFANNQQFVSTVANSEAFMRVVLSKDIYIERFGYGTYYDLIASSSHVATILSSKTETSTTTSLTDYVYLTRATLGLTTLYTSSGDTNRYISPGVGYTAINGAEVVHTNTRSGAEISSLTVTINKIVKKITALQNSGYDGYTKTTVYANPVIYYKNIV